MCKELKRKKQRLLLLYVDCRYIFPDPDTYGSSAWNAKRSCKNTTTNKNIKCFKMQSTPCDVKHIPQMMMIYNLNAFLLYFFSSLSTFLLCFFSGLLSSSSSLPLKTEKKKRGKHEKK